MKTHWDKAIRCFHHAMNSDYNICEFELGKWVYCMHVVQVHPWFVKYSSVTSYVTGTINIWFHNWIDWDHHIWYWTYNILYQIWWSQSIVESKLDLTRFFPCALCWFALYYSCHIRIICIKYDHNYTVCVLPNLKSITSDKIRIYFLTCFHP